MEKYYTLEQMAQFEELRAETPPEEMEAVGHGGPHCRSVRWRTSRASRG